MLLGECIGLVAPLHGVLGAPYPLVGPVHQGYVGWHDGVLLSYPAFPYGISFAPYATRGTNSSASPKWVIS